MEKLISNTLKSLWQVYRAQRLSPKSLEQACTKKLINTVQLAYQQIPFYRQSFDKIGINSKQIQSASDLKKLPLLSKDEVRTYFDNKDLIAPGYDLTNSIISHTSGSSGKPLSFLFPHQTYAYYLAQHLRSFFLMGYKPWHHLVYIKANTVNSTSIGPFFKVSHIKDKLSCQQRIVQLIDYKTDFLIGYASNILQIAESIHSTERKKLKLKGICLNSEQSTQEQRDFISDIFNCPVFDEYSCEELWMIASQCKHQNYHIFSDNVWLELLDEEGMDVVPGEIGEVVLTSLNNDAMPFIRYRLGDYAVKSDKLCRCGSSFPVLESINGRINDSFLLANGRRVTSAELMTLLGRFILSIKQYVGEYQLIQTDYDKATLKIIAAKSHDKALYTRLEQKISEQCNTAIAISIEFVDNIEQTGIKRKQLKSLL